jgi:acyl-CoA synthetase (AMP-forming)/AMP-acid ligase II
VKAVGPRELAVLVRSGVLGPGRPDRVAHRLYRLARFGPSPAGAYATAAARCPNRTAVLDERESRTFTELDDRVRAVARGLRAAGVREGDSVAILGRNSVRFVEALVGTSRIGADALLLSTFLAPAQVAEVVRRERPALVIADPTLLPLLADVEAGAAGEVPVVVTRPDPARSGRTLDDLAAAPGADPGPPTRNGRLVVLTSGTTGTPKGARRPPPDGLGPAASILSRLRLGRRERMLIASPLFHTWGLAMLQLAPALGATVVLRERPDPIPLLEAVDRERCTALIAVPVILQRLVDLPADTTGRYRTSTLRVVASSGSALPPDLCTSFMDAYGDVLYNVYGSTEISWATIATPEDLRAVPGTAGKPPLSTTLMLLDDQDRPVPTGRVGRVFVGNALLFEGYTNGSGRPVVQGLMATGDHGVLDAGGRLSVVGREDDLVVTGGEKVYPLEVEHAIVAMPQVREVAVVGRPDERMGQRLVAFVVAEPGSGLTVEQVQDQVRHRLARFAVPREVQFLEVLPRNATGKVVPRLLPA